VADDNKGLLASLGQLTSTLLEVAYTRLEILSTDLEEDRLHLLSMMGLLLVALFFLVVGAVIAITLLVFVLWESHRLLALALVATFFIAAGVSLGVLAFYQHKRKPRLLATTLSELKKDKERLD